MLREVAEYPNCFGPLGAGSERIETPRLSRPILERLGFERVGEVHMLLDVFADG